MKYFSRFVILLIMIGVTNTSFSKESELVKISQPLGDGETVVVPVGIGMPGALSNQPPQLSTAEMSKLMSKMRESQ